MLRKPRLAVVDVVERSRQAVVVVHIRGKILQDDVLQLAEFLVSLAVMLRESLYVEVIVGLASLQSLHIREHRLLLVAHVVLYGMGIFVVEFHYQAGQIVVFVERGDKFLAYERKLEVEEILMAGLQVVEQRRNRKAPIIVYVAVSVDGEVHHRQKGIGVHLLVFAHFAHRLVAETQVYSKASESL